MRLTIIAMLVSISCAAQAQTMIEVHDAPPPVAPRPPVAPTPPVAPRPPVAPPPTVAPTPPMTDVRVVVRALERNDRRARDRALIAAGSVLLGAGYATALTLGALTLDSYGDCGDGGVSPASATLFVPVLGPFISGPLSGSAAWAIPVMLVDGAAQVAGLALVIDGARSERRLSLMPIVGASTIGLGVSGRM